MSKIGNWLMAALSTFGLLFGTALGALTISAGPSTVAAAQAPQLTLYDG